MKGRMSNGETGQSRQASRNPGTVEPHPMRPAREPNQGNSNRSPCHALNERTTHRKNIPSEPTIPSSRSTTAAAMLESRIPANVARKNTPHKSMLCQAWQRTKLLLRKAGRHSNTAAGTRVKYPLTAAHRSPWVNGLMERPHSGQNTASTGIDTSQRGQRISAGGISGALYESTAIALL